MLQSLSTHSIAPVLSQPLNTRAHALPEAEVRAIADSHDQLKCTLEIFLRAANQGKILPLKDGPCTDGQSSDFTIVRSLPELRKLRAALQKSVGSGDHCIMCKGVSLYLKTCWERQRLLMPSWYGVAHLNMDVLSRFLNHMLAFASQLDSNDPQACNQHAQFGRLVSEFLALDDAKKTA